LRLFGYLGEAPAELVAERHELFSGLAHSYDQQRSLAARVPESTLRLTPVSVGDAPANWRELIGG
jgi:hypothetical protein